MNKIKHIYYRSYDPFYNKQWYHLDIDKKRETYMKEKGKQKMRKEKYLDGKELFYQVMMLEDILEKWKDYYVDPTILDGVEYKIGIKYEDHTCRVIEGKNQFPENFALFEQLIGV